MSTTLDTATRALRVIEALEDGSQGAYRKFLEAQTVATTALTEINKP